jgi:hypothetical protein
VTRLACVFVVLLFFQDAEPQPVCYVVARLRCGANQFAVLDVSNPSKANVYFPLSPLYADGYTIHNIQPEVDEQGHWHTIARGSDLPSAGKRKLGPGEAFRDLFQLPSLDSRVVSKKMRLVIPVIVKGQYADVRTPAFDPADLPQRSDIPCPRSR